MRASKIVNASSVRHAIGELLLIVAGILIALAVSDWHDRNRQREQELLFLHELQSALTSDLAALETNAKLWKETATKIDSLIEILETRPPYDPSFNALFGAAYGLRPANLNTAAFESLESAGLQSISDARLRLSIAKVFDQHYESLDLIDQIDINVTMDVMRPYYLQNFSGLEFLNSATPLDYDAVVSDRYFQNIVEYRLAVIQANQVSSYTAAIQDMRAALALMAEELGQ